MKLFQSLLVAPAALGLMAPLAVNASEVNLNDISTYSELDTVGFSNSFNKEEANDKQLIAGGEGLVSGSSYDGGFSSTTTAAFSTDFYLGSLDGGTTGTNHPIQAAYGFQIDLNTSFTGEDSLDISIDAGNAPTNNAGSSTSPLAEFDQNATADVLTVDGVSYTFPIGGLTAIVGDNTDGSALFTTACVYGGPSNTLDDCGNVNAGITNGGTAFGASYDFGNGFTTALGYAGAGTAGEGLMTKETLDAFGANVAYSADQYGVSVTYGAIETGTNGVTESTYTALNGYYSFDNGLNVSAGYEIGDIGANASTQDESINYFFGVNGEVGPGELGAAVGTSGGQLEHQTEELMWEAYYSYPVNDGMTITPLVYIKEQATAGTPDQTGVMVKTSFSF